MASNNMNVTFTGNATNLISAVNQSTSAINGLKQATTFATTGMIAEGVALGITFAGVANKIKQFAFSLASDYTHLGDDLYKLMKITGSSAEEMSKLKYAADITGVSMDLLTRNFKILYTHLGANDNAAKEFGVTVRNANGTMRSTIDILGDLSDKWINMADKTKAAEMGSKLFGRSFVDMTPLLALGSQGIKDLADQAQKMGLVLSGKNVNDIRAYNMAHRQMKAAVSSVSIAIGNELLPILSGLTIGITNGITAIKNFMTQSGALQTVIKGIIIFIGALTTAYALNAAWSGITAAATWILDGAMGAVAFIAPICGAAVALLTGDFVALDVALSALGIPQIIFLVTALVAAIIWAVRSTDTGKKIFIAAFELMGSAVGGWVFIAVEGFKNVIDGFALLVRGLGKGASWLGETFHIGWLKSAGDGVTGFLDGIDKSLDSFAAKAKIKGTQIGKNVGTGLANAIDNFKFPSLQMPDVPTGPDTTPPGGGGTTKKKKGASTSAALNATKDLAKTILDGMKDAAQTAIDNAENTLAAIKDAQSALVDAAKEMVQSTKDMWNDLVNAASDSMKAALDAAKSAQDKLTNLASSVSDAITSGFGITDIFKASYAQWTGPTWFLNMFKQRLSDAKKFVADIKALSAAGLSPALLSQLAQAGPENGLGAAEMMMGNVGMIAELNNLQAQLDATAAEGGAFVGQLIYGGEAASTAQAATSATAAYNKTVADAAAANKAAADALNQTQLDAANAIAAGQAGVDTAKGGLKQLNNLTVNVSSPASADQIAAEIAWSLATGNKTVTVFGTAMSPQTSMKQALLGV